LEILKSMWGNEVWDIRAGKGLFTLPSSYELKLLDSRHLLVVSKAGGVSFYFYDVPSGKWTDTYRPFAHLPWVWLGLGALFVAWAWVWIKTNVAAGGAWWWDHALTLWLPSAAIVAFAARSANLGSQPDYVLQLWLGLVIGALAALVPLAMLPRQVLWLRYRSWLIWFMVSFVLMQGLVVYQAYYLQYVAWLQLAPLLLLITGFQVLRMLRVRLSQPGEPAVDRSKDAATLADLFMLTSLVAMSFGMWSIGGGSVALFLESMGFGRYWMIAVAAILAILNYGAFSQRGWLVGLCVCLSVSAAVTSVAILMTEWTLGQSFERTVRHACEVRVLLAASAVSFIGCWPLRLRGWRCR
jgi:hypothetical protein